ncbi:MAG: cation-translocating P-type ATPase, partial [Methanoregulaceae archaeon]
MTPDLQPAAGPAGSPAPQPLQFHALTAGEVIAALGSGDGGLDAGEVEKRLRIHGKNSLREAKKKSVVMLFFQQFTSLLILILIIAAVISGLFGEWADAVAILIIVLLNGVIGFIQEYRAEKALESLKRMTASHSQVIRGGMTLTLETSGLVPGDMVLIAEGDKVPADARLVEVVGLEANEATLTGESVPDPKDAHRVLDPGTPLSERANMVYQGTVITHGRGRAVVTATGVKTELGRIAELVVDKPEPETPLQEQLRVLAKQLSTAALGLVALIFVMGILRGYAPVELFLITVSLAVAAIPEGLPTVVTITLAIGVQRMAAHHAVIRKLPAVEVLGAATVICTDKTGTLTKNEMTVRSLFANGSFFTVTGEGYAANGTVLKDGKEVTDAADRKALDTLITTGVLCNTSRLTRDAATGAVEIAGDPTETALLVLAEKGGPGFRDVREKFPCGHELPFDSVRKMMTVICTVEGHERAFVKGAPEILLARCDRMLRDGTERTLTDEDREQAHDAVRRMGSGALRVLAFAYRDIATGEREGVESQLVFAGLAGMMDPPREEAKRAIAACHDAGIRVIMITGDNPETARAVAGELGIFAPGVEAVVVTGPEMDTWSEEDFRTSVRNVRVYARVNPEHKLRIVRALQDGGEVVAMTGDGVNDAPAIIRADIGIAMGLTGTEVTKDVSDMVIMDDNFASIERAVEEGRVIYENILKSARFLITCNLGELAAITLALLAGLASPLAPLQILWMNIVTDSPPALALAMDPADPDTMKRPPRRPKQQILTWQTSKELIITGLVIALVTLGVFAGYLAGGPGQAAKAGTMAFSVIVISQLFTALAFSGSRERSLFGTGLSRNPWFWAAFGFGLVTQF